MDESLSATEFAKQMKNKNNKELNETKVLYDAYGQMYETIEQLNGARQKQLDNLYQTFEGLDVMAISIHHGRKYYQSLNTATWSRTVLAQNFMKFHPKEANYLLLWGLPCLCTC
jgi:hypothetical protein